MGKFINPDGSPTDFFLTEYDRLFNPPPRKSMQLPSYQSHKIVQAAKIEAIDGPNADGDWTLNLGELGLQLVDGEWFQVHAPIRGSYLVRAGDGKTARVLADVFEKSFKAMSKVVAPDEPEAQAESDEEMDARVRANLADIPKPEHPWHYSVGEDRLTWATQRDMDLAVICASSYGRLRHGLMKLLDEADVRRREFAEKNPRPAPVGVGDSLNASPDDFAQTQPQPE